MRIAPVLSGTIAREATRPETLDGYTGEGPIGIQLGAGGSTPGSPGWSPGRGCGGAPCEAFRDARFAARYASMARARIPCGEWRRIRCSVSASFSGVLRSRYIV